jgi:hypothetical protein
VYQNKSISGGKVELDSQKNGFPTWLPMLLVGMGIASLVIAQIVV